MKCGSDHRHIIRNTCAVLTHPHTLKFVTYYEHATYVVTARGVKTDAYAMAYAFYKAIVCLTLHVLLYSYVLQIIIYTLSANRNNRIDTIHNTHTHTSKGKNHHVQLQTCIILHMTIWKLHVVASVKTVLPTSEFSLGFCIDRNTNYLLENSEALLKRLPFYIVTIRSK